MADLTLVSQIANGLFIAMVAGIPLYAGLKRVPVYDTFIEGAEGGIRVIIKILPYMTAMIVAVGMFRASGGFAHISLWLQPVLLKFHIPADLVPLALVRPFSGAASNGILADIIHTHGGNALVSHMAGTMMGSTETTFYVIAVYFGAVRIRQTRHAVPAGLFADFVGMIASIVVCRYLLLP